MCGCALQIHRASVGFGVQRPLTWATDSLRLSRSASAANLYVRANVEVGFGSQYAVLVLLYPGRQIPGPWLPVTDRRFKAPLVNGIALLRTDRNADGGVDEHCSGCGENSGT